MRAPKKVIAAMAMATLIGGTVAPAFADDFEHSTGIDKGMQKAIITVNEDKNTAEGDIEINGRFNKTVTTLPDVKAKGDFLRITMPLALNYNYDLSTDSMNAVEGTVSNQSGTATEKTDSEGRATGEFDFEHKSVKMSFVGINNTNDSIEYVENLKAVEPGKAQLPFKLVITRSNGEVLRNIPLANLVKKDGQELEKKIKELEIEAKTSINMKIEQINGQPVRNGEALNGQSVSSPLTLKFEYVRK